MPLQKSGGSSGILSYWWNRARIPYYQRLETSGGLELAMPVLPSMRRKGVKSALDSFRIYSKSFGIVIDPGVYVVGDFGAIKPRRYRYALLSSLQPKR